MGLGFFSKCGDKEFETLRDCGFEISVSGTTPEITKFPEGWVETGGSTAKTAMGSSALGTG